MRNNWNNLEGQRFGKLTAVKTVGIQTGGTCLLWLCTCDCGNDRIVPSHSLSKGKATRCLEEHYRDNHIEHGMSYSPEYRAYSSMLSRCSNRNVDQYSNYGGRGISVCEEWKGKTGFPKFLEHMGPRPSPGHSLDRIDSEKIYEPSNCKWSTRSEQSKNRRPFVAINNYPLSVLFKELFRRCVAVPTIS